MGRAGGSEIKSKGEREDSHLTGQRYARWLVGSVSRFVAPREREEKNRTQAGKKRESEL